MGDWTGFLIAAVIIMCAIIFVKASKKLLTLACLVALICWIVYYGLPALGL